MVTRYRRKKRTRALRFGSIAGLSTACILAAAWLLFVSPLLRFSTITIRPSRQEIADRVALFIYQDDKRPPIFSFLVRQSLIAERILNELPETSKVSFVTDPFRRELIASVFFEPAWARICSLQSPTSPETPPPQPIPSEECLFVTSKGRLFHSMFHYQPALTLRTKGSIEQNAILEPHLFSALRVIHETFVKQNVRITSIELFESKDVRVLTDPGWYALIDTDADVNEQLKKLTLTLNRIATPSSSFKYFDVRIPKKVFYR